MAPTSMLKKMAAAESNFVLILMTLYTWKDEGMTIRICNIHKWSSFSYDYTYTISCQTKKARKNVKNQIQSHAVHLWQIIGRLENAFKLSLGKMITNWH